MKKTRDQIKRKYIVMGKKGGGRLERVFDGGKEGIGVGVGIGVGKILEGEEDG